MADDDRISNSTDYDITMGRLCPFCRNADSRLLEKINAGWLCCVCSKIWQGLPGKYRGGWPQ